MAIKRSMFKKLFRRCFLCEGKENLSTVTQWGIYSSNSYCHYHPECVRRVLNNPEEHPDLVDTAIYIMDKIEEALESDRQERERRQLRLQGARDIMNNVDRIMGSIDEQNRAGSPKTETTDQKETQNV